MPPMEQSFASDVSLPAQTARRVRGRGQVMQRARGRGRRGHGGQRNVGAICLSQDDARRVLELQNKRISYEQARIQQLSLENSHQILGVCLTPDPSLMFDVMQMTSSGAPPSGAPPSGPPLPGQPTWCVCSNCREMPTDIERKCCGQQQEYCISTLPHLEAYILQEGVLRLARLSGLMSGLFLILQSLGRAINNFDMLLTGSLLFGNTVHLVRGKGWLFPAAAYGKYAIVFLILEQWTV